MKKFDPAAAKRGATVCTRDGWPARILCFDFEGPYKPIVAAIKVKEHEELIREYSNNGRFDGYSNCYADLMMADDDYLEKLERGEYDHIDENFELEDKSDHIDEATEKVDWVYWRMKYAGDFMCQLIAAGKLSGVPVDITMREVRKLSDALIEELKR